MGTNFEARYEFFKFYIYYDKNTQQFLCGKSFWLFNLITGKFILISKITE